MCTWVQMRAHSAQVCAVRVGGREPVCACPHLCSVHTGSLMETPGLQAMAWLPEVPGPEVVLTEWCPPRRRGKGTWATCGLHTELWCPPKGRVCLATSDAPSS